VRGPLFVLGIVLLLGAEGCQKKSETTESNAPPAGSGSVADQLPPKDVTSQPGEVIASIDMHTPLEGVYLRPYLDEAGATERAVAVGEAFDVYLYSETVEPYSTNAAQFRMDLPPGVKVTGVMETEHRSISMGNYATNYSIAYECQPAGKFLLMTFHCVAEPGFRGGEILIAPGLPGQNESYLGYSTCEYYHAPANGGKATLKQK
jgi:hypothetical protein